MKESQLNARKYWQDECLCGNWKHRQSKRCMTCVKKNRRGQLSRNIKKQMEKLSKIKVEDLE